MPRNEKDSELVLGLISTVGTDTDEVIKNLEEQLAFFRYKTELISVSSDIVTTVEKRYTGHHQRKRQWEGFFSKSASAKPRNVR